MQWPRKLKGWTVTGAALTALSWLAAQPHLTRVEVAQAVGGFLTAVGFRDAMRKGER